MKQSFKLLIEAISQRSCDMHREERKMNIVIRTEEEKEYGYVETLIRTAFWNVYKPGCDEHVMAHKLRESYDFLPNLDFVAELDGKVVGSVICSKAKVVDEEKRITDDESLVAVGPICVLPQLQNSGIGSLLMEGVKQAAKAAGYKGLVLYGNPKYYHRFGFVNAKEYGITMPDGNNIEDFMVLELDTDRLEDVQGKCYESDAFEVSEEELSQYESRFNGENAMEINPCGTYCEGCEDNGVVCDGCRNRDGKPIWYDLYAKTEPCEYYTCTKEHQYHDCSQCPNVPCNKYFSYPDPNMTDEMKQMWFKLRMENFNHINCVRNIKIHDTFPQNEDVYKKEQ